MDQPPCKKQKISPIKCIARNGKSLNDNEILDKSEKDEECKENQQTETYYYTLHVNESIILVSTDPEIPCNTNYDFDDNNEPNLFIVRGADPIKYDSSIWLNYHLNLSNDIRRAVELLSNKNISLLIVTGAGMGCDSNLPDYRSPNGFWNDYKPFQTAKTLTTTNNKNNKNASELSLYDMSKSDWFNTDPLSAWGFYTHRSILYRDAIPHSGYKTLLNYTFSRNYYYMTSNIDGQAMKAGFSPHKIYQTHGSLHFIQCTKFCDNSFIMSFNKEYDKLSFNKNTFRISDINDIPTCHKCNSIMRPNVSFFSDSYATFNPKRIFKQKNKFMEWLQRFAPDSMAQDNCNDNKINKKKKRKLKTKLNLNNIDNKLIILEIGCGKSIHSLRWECEYLKTLDNVTLIRINPTEEITINDNNNNNNKLKSRHVTLKLPAKLAFDTIDKYMRQNANNH